MHSYFVLADSKLLIQTHKPLDKISINSTTYPNKNNKNQLIININISVTNIKSLLTSSLSPNEIFKGWTELLTDTSID